MLAVASAACFGASDFVAGIASRRTSAAAVGVVVQTTAAILAAGFALASGVTIGSHGVLWSAVAGVGSGIGTFGLYRGLARGRMSVVAPVAALTSAALPVLVGIALGEQPGTLAWAGIALALPATALVASVGETGADRPSGIRDALLAGLGFTVLYVGLHEAGHDSGTWPVVVQMACSLVVLVPIAVAGLVRRAGQTNQVGASGRPDPIDRAGAGNRAGRLGRAACLVRAGAVRRRRLSAVTASVFAGALGAAAAGLFVAAAAGGLAIAAVLTSLFPAFTVLLARAVLHEPIRHAQAIGLVAAAVAVGLIAA
jgi:drug/metabolite transporter (DMT)-like permease